MSGISFQTFVDQARLNRDGDMRLDARSQTELVNKGTLGNKVATWLNMGDVNSRTERTQEAIRQFKEALSQEYGEHYATKALESMGIIDDKGGVKTDRFTGNDVLDAIDRIEGRRGLMEQDKDSRARLLESEVSTQSQTLGLTPRGREVFRARLEQAFDALTEGGTRGVDRNDLTELAAGIAGTIRALEDSGTLETSQQARAKFEMSLGRAIGKLGESPEKLLQRLDEASQDVLSLHALEDTTHVSTLQGSVNRVIKDLTNRDFDTMFENMGRALHPTSSLRALYCAAKSVIEDDGNSELERRRAGAVMLLCEAIIRGLGSTGDARPRTLSVDGDLELLRERDGVDPKTLDRGEIAMKGQVDSTLAGMLMRAPVDEN